MDIFTLYTVNNYYNWIFVSWKYNLWVRFRSFHSTHISYLPTSSDFGTQNNKIITENIKPLKANPNYCQNTVQGNNELLMKNLK